MTSNEVVDIDYALTLMGCWGKGTDSTGPSGACRYAERAIRQLRASVDTLNAANRFLSEQLEAERRTRPAHETRKTTDRAENLAKALEHYLKAHDTLSAVQDTDDVSGTNETSDCGLHDAANDAWRAMRTALHEYRKPRLQQETFPPLGAETRAATSGSEVTQIEDAGRPQPTLWDCACNLTNCPYCGPRLQSKAAGSQHAITCPHHSYQEMAAVRDCTCGVAPDTLVRWTSPITWRCRCKSPGDINASNVSICADCGTARPEKNG